MSYREVALQIGKAAAERARELASKSESYEIVGYHGNDVSRQADVEVERTIVEKVRELLPRFSIVTEESGRIDRSEPDGYVIVDPIDGSTNYANRIPWSSVSIAVIGNDGRQGGTIFPIWYGLPVSYDNNAVYEGESRVTRNRNPSKIVYISISNSSSEILSKILPKLKGYKLRQMGASSLEMTYTCLGKGAMFMDLRGRLRPFDIIASSSVCGILGYGIYSLDGKRLELDPLSLDELGKPIYLISDLQLSQTLGDLEF